MRSSTRKTTLRLAVCALALALSGAAVEDDVVPGIPFQPGEKVQFGELDKLRAYLPEPVWEYREYFFFEGMDLEIGEFYKDYPISEERKVADEKYGGQAQVGPDGEILNHKMGQPFHDIDPSDPLAGVKHAWNFQYKHDALEGRAHFYFTYWDNGERLPLWFEGTGWGLRLSHRPDHMDNEGHIFNKEKRYGAGGFEIKSPADYRGILGLGYRYKALDGPRSESRETDVWVYIPDLRRVRRISGSRRTDPIAGTDMTAEDQGGFNGVIPEFEWTLVAEVDLLAPIDTRLEGYPRSKEENFGPYGFSMGNDVWQLRKAIVLEQKAKKSHIYKRKRIWLDRETYQPLYATAWDRRDEIWKVMQLAHHWSERDDQPNRIDGVNALLPSGNVLVNVMTGTGVRIELYDAQATRLKRGRLRKQIDIGRLAREGR